MTEEEIEQRVLDDLVEYMKEQGYPISKGRAFHHEIDVRSEWSGGCDTCAFEYTVTAVTVYFADAPFGQGTITMEGFNMADFLAWVYAKG